MHAKRKSAITVRRAAFGTRRKPAQTWGLLLKRQAGLSRATCPERSRGKSRGIPVLLVLLTLVFIPDLRAQFNSGGTAALGDFLNPLTVTIISPADTCNYDLLQIDLAQGKVFARPFRNGANATCNSTALEDITSQVFQPIPPSTTPIVVPPGFPDGLLEVGSFTLRLSTLAGAAATNLTLEFVSNADNTPVVIRATGSVTINAGSVLSVRGSVGQLPTSTFSPGVGGNGGPGGYRGGNGGLGGLVPTAAAAGLGPGGGPGGAIGAAPTVGATFLTTGTTAPIVVGGTTIPVGNDLLTMLRGGSGGGGFGGTTAGAGKGGGGGGGAILIAATNTVTVSGTVTAQGGDNGFPVFGGEPRSAPGSGGMVRIVATTIAGGGALSALAGRAQGGSIVGSANGIIRLEAFFITYTGTFAGPVAVSNTPGTIVLPSTPTAFIRFAQLTDSANALNTVAVPSATQATPGRTGFITAPDVTMVNPGGVAATSVGVDLTIGPNTIATPFPAGKTATLVVAPLDPGQGGAVNYTAAITCVSLGTDCTATITGVTLPLGLSSMTAFTVVDLTTGGQLARMFPRTYEGEAIESVRIQTSGTDTEYVLIARSGKQFPYKPAGGR